jgi:hypothetical protein
VKIRLPSRPESHRPEGQLHGLGSALRQGPRVFRQGPEVTTRGEDEVLPVRGPGAAARARCARPAREQLARVAPVRIHLPESRYRGLEVLNRVAQRLPVGRPARHGRKAGRRHKRTGLGPIAPGQAQVGPLRVSDPRAIGRPGAAHRHDSRSQVAQTSGRSAQDRPHPEVSFVLEHLEARHEKLRAARGDVQDLRDSGGQGDGLAAGASHLGEETLPRPVAPAVLCQEVEPGAVGDRLSLEETIVRDLRRAGDPRVGRGRGPP